MRPLSFLFGILLACTIDGPVQDAYAGTPTVTAAPTMKLCLPSNTTVKYSVACPAGTTSTKKICPDGTQVGYSTSCPVAALPPSTPAAQPTRKLCQPSGTTVGYRDACPAGTTSTLKICPYGQTVAYSAKCSTTPPAEVALAYNGKAKAVLACQSLTNPADSLEIGAVYTVTGFAVLTPIGHVSGPGEQGPPDVAILSRDDGVHLGDGWFAFYVPIACVVGTA